MTNENECSIVSLKIENVKVVEAVEIRPDGNLVIIGGQNGQGKTTTLDCVSYAMGGKRSICDEPLRKGAESGSIEMDLGRFIVERTFDKNGTTKLVVRSHDGAKYSSPQDLLDELNGQLGFDPLAFSRMEAKEQARMLRELLGIDTTMLDGERARIFDERTIINREGKALKARFLAMPHHPDAPETRVDTVELARQLEESTASEQVVLDRSIELREMQEKWESVNNKQVEVGNKISELVMQIDGLKIESARLHEKAEDFGKANPVLEKKVEEAHAAVIDKQPLMKAIETAGETNQQISENAARAAVQTELNAKRAAAEKNFARLEEIDAEKTKLMAAVEFPVDDLGFNDSGVTYQGVPFDQASSAEQLRVSVAIGIAMNPKLRVMLLRDGSLLDENNMRLISEMAEKNKMQIWLERVGTGDEVSVVIENGKVLG